MAVDLSPENGPGWFTRARLVFRRWRRSRPFWGGLILILAGLELFGSGNLQPTNFTIHLGVEGFLGYLVPAIIILCGVLGWATPAQRMFYGILGVLAALYSLISVNLGGFFIGMLIGIVGGSMMVAWVPRRRKDGPVALDAGEPDAPDGSDTEQILPFEEESEPGAADEIGAEGKQGERFPGPRHAASDRVARTAIAVVAAVALTGAAGLIALQSPAPAAAANCLPPPSLTQLIKSAKPTPPAAKTRKTKAPAPKTSATSGTTHKTETATGTGTRAGSAKTPVGRGDSPVAGSAKTSAGQGDAPVADSGTGGGILGGLLGGLGKLLGGDPSPSPSTSPSATPTASPKASPSTKPSPSAKPSPSTKPSASTNPSTKPTTSPTGKPTASPSVTPSPTATCDVKARRLAAAAGQVTVEETPSIQTADLLTMTNVSYVGNVSLPTASGTIQVMEFTMDSSTSTPFELDITTKGQVIKVKSSKLTVSGHVIFYATEIKGNALGILPQDYTPSSPPPLVPPDVFFTDVTIHLIDVQCDSLTTASDFSET